jgi:hypothetical protein
MVLYEAPRYEPGKDLEVVSRTNDKGAVVVTEVWTRRDFNPGELLFAPWSTEIKSGRFTRGKSAHLELPAYTVPGNKILGLDGRGLGQLENHDKATYRSGSKGCLFWAISRTSDPEEANLSLEYSKVSFPRIKVALPGKETERNTSLGKDGVPQVPLLINKARVGALTMLLALDDKVMERELDKAEKEEAEQDKSDKKRKRALNGEARGLAAGTPRRVKGKSAPRVVSDEGRSEARGSEPPRELAEEGEKEEAGGEADEEDEAPDAEDEAPDAEAIRLARLDEETEADFLD